MIPGEVIYASDEILCNQGRDPVTLSVENTSRYPVYVTSHYHFFEVNRRLRFDRRAAYGKRLDVPSGSGVRWEPGAAVEVRLIDIGGRRMVYGYQGFVNGSLSEEQVGDALARVQEQGFLDTGEQSCHSN